MATQRTLMPSPNASNKLTYYAGGSLGLSNAITLRSDSRARLPITIGDVLKQETSHQDDGKWCPPYGASTQRPNLINMKCRYFYSFTGCTRADCRFLHDEKPGDVVFHDGSEKIRQRPTEYIAPGPRVDVKIFIGNLPPGTLSSFVIDIASPFGEVKSCVVLKSNQRNGRCPAVLFMSSYAQADAAINAINAHIDPCGQRAYARKEYSRPLENNEPQVLPTHLKTLIRGTQAATTQAKERAQPQQPQQPQPPQPPQPQQPQPQQEPTQTMYFKASVQSVAKDGNCLFSAIQLGDKSTVREVAVDWIESHLDADLWGGFTYRSYIEDEKKIKADAYIANMRKTGVWGGLPELYALATLSGIRIRVFEEISTGVFKLIANDFGASGGDTRDVCLRSDHYDSLTNVWPLDKQEVARMESKEPTKPVQSQPAKPTPMPTKSASFKLTPTKPAVESTPPKHGKKSAKPVLNSDGDGFCAPKKSSKIVADLHQTLTLSSSFAALYDLPEDWDLDPDTEQDKQDAGLRTTHTDKEVATLTPNKPPALSSMPALTHNVSPVSTITAVWAFEYTKRKGRVMTPIAHENTAEMNGVDGWCILRRNEWSDA